MHTSVALLLELGIVLTVLGALGTMARRIGLSPVPLYLLAGLAIGRGGIAPLPAAEDFVELGASIGVVLLLLTLGLEFSIDEFTVTLRRHVPSGLVDLVLNATPGALAGLLLGLQPLGVIALAGVTWVSSSTIISRLLDDLHRLGNRETPAVLSILLLEDFAMAVYLPLLAVLAAAGTLWQGMASVSVAVGVLVLALFASHRWGHRMRHLVDGRETEQLMLRIVGLALVVAALAEAAGTSAAVGAFLVGLALTGTLADRVRAVISPLRDLFAAAFFLAIGISVDPADLLPLLPVAAALAVITGLTKMATGWFAARRAGSGFRGQMRAATALLVRGEFSIIIVSLIAAPHEPLGPLVTGYVLILALAGPLITWIADRPVPALGPPR